MKLGSVEHKELFCRQFMETYRDYEPESLPWPDLDDVALATLRGIPFWEKALDIEREAGAMVSTYAKTVKDPLIQEAIALQGREESRHSRLIQTLINRYGIEISARPPVILPENIEPAFITFGFEECVDSFFAFGLFAIAKEANIFPEQLFTIFDPILDEEARHIVFLVNWFTYIQIERGQGFPLLRNTKTLLYYAKALSNLIGAFSGTDSSGTGFTATGANTFMDNLTLEKFIAVCLRENEYRMSKYDSRLLQPRFIPRLTNIAYKILQLIPKRKQPTLATST
ncbi:MAG TPA: ferritin-like domain-containing protein [Nostocaceae cyanobacterium]|nr:ferritin-like domain-containing protein [Nostocaceae cyanobacterium]